ncbi:beta-N-acetylhexosaminidase [Psychroserpens luteolus]|uniref:beta-N-acetylhexosaminidase n=1 Tax=Psychroserpens luteolus TaxID=2855840 RepID=UPI001E53AE18|nr:family 20 glycosylhydrolase [Psychroserpens luteolus]MCD2259282.1 family 20 glycosylhydrolase [Psychroserpens luteolus]
MSFKKIVALSVFISFLFNCKSEEYRAEIPQIIPIPSTQTINKGYFVLDDNVGISYDDTFKISGDFLRHFIENGSEIKLKNNNDIQFIKDETINNKEGYTLDIQPYQISIRTNTDQGAFYAVQTLRQLLPKEFENNSTSEEKISIQCMTITDEPQFKYRGMHLDVGRHMFSVDFIKKYIDALAMLKMNTFHWHLTEDQGWRIEIKKYPKLQELAAFRNETLIGHYSDQPHQFDGKRYGGFYTQEEVKDIVTYAQSRHVTVIPEIELPGHAQAAISAYPDLGCTGEQVDVATKWGVFEHIYCSKDETFNFLEDVLDEVITLFPSEYIHIGGDEAPKTKWKTCKQCQNRIKSEGLKDEHELQNYFITRIETYLNAKGKQIIGWDEILEGGLAPNATVMSWRGTKGAVEAAKQKHNVVMTPTSHCYFDYYQSTNADEPTAIGGFLPLEKVYSFNPIPEELTEDEVQYVLGAQGNIWTEYMPTQEHVEYMAFPRMLAMSEVVWSKSDNKDYTNFTQRVEHFNKRLDALSINYANHLYEISGELVSKNNTTSYQLSTTIQDKHIRFTLDGSEPNLASELYTQAIPINTSQTIKAAVFNSEKRLGAVFSETINYHKGVGKTITINKTPHKSYSGSGPQGLINGISGSDSRYGDKEWLGFWGEDIEITIDLGEKIDVYTIDMRFYNGEGQWIYAPKYVNVIYDDLEERKIILNKRNELQHDVKINNQNKQRKSVLTRYIKIKVPNYGTIPDGKQGAGNKAWTFIDEIIIN